MRIPVYERQVGIGPLPGGYVNTSAGADAYGAGVGQAVQGLGTRMMEIAQDREDARTLEMFNQFKRDSLNYHEDPDKGIYNTRLGGDAWGVTKDSDGWMRELGEKYVKGLGSGRMRQNFRRMAEGFILQQGERNSRFEAEQVKQYRDGQARATIQTGLDAIAGDVWSDETAARELENMTEAWELMNRGKSPEEREASWAEIKNQAATVRLNGVIQQDPVKAKTWLEEHKDEFTGAGYLKAKDTADKAAKSYEVQAFVDEWVKTYPEGREQEGIAAIRERFSGPEEEERVRAYRQRLDEMSISENWERQQEQRRWRDNYFAYLDNYYAKGEVPTIGELDNALANGEISPVHYEQLLKLTEQAARAAGARKWLGQHTPDWAALPDDKQDELVMRRLGVSREDHDTVIEMLTAHALDFDGYMDQYFDAEVKEWGTRGAITRREAAQFLGLRRAMTKDQKEAVTYAQKTFNDRLGQILNYKKNENGKTLQSKVPGLKKAAEDHFNTAISSLDKSSPNYRKDLMAAVTESLLWAARGERSGLAWGNSSSDNWDNPTDFGRLIGNLYYQTQRESKNAQPIRTGITPSQVNLPGRQGADNGNLGPQRDLGIHILGGINAPTVKGGEPGAPRDEGKRKHAGRDYSAPVGTPIMTPDLGVSLKVTKVSTDKNTVGGYGVRLEGTLADGRRVNLYMCHMKAGSIGVKVNDTPKAGQVIGQVGNTGTGSHGAHLHLELKVNGQPVDPAKFEWPKAAQAEGERPELGGGGLFAIPAPGK